jgi:hypothetical protein
MNIIEFQNRELKTRIKCTKLLPCREFRSDLPTRSDRIEKKYGSAGMNVVSEEQQSAGKIYRKYIAQPEKTVNN